MGVVETLRMEFDEENMFETTVKCLKYILWPSFFLSGKLVDKHLILYVMKAIRK